MRRAMFLLVATSACTSPFFMAQTAFAASSGDLPTTQVPVSKKRHVAAEGRTRQVQPASVAQDGKKRRAAAMVLSRQANIAENQPLPKDEQVIVTGTRSTNVRARQSMSPVVVVSGAKLAQSGSMNTSDALARLYPSLEVTPRGHNTNALTSFIEMRGLDPNEVLVLVNGKRRHSTANIVQKSGPEFASSSVDLNMIPSNMIDHIEILEDGAAAMYGSDAIAGVVNVITKKQDHGLNLSGQTGANAYNGDGWQYQFNADGGLKLGNDGYMHISGQVYHTDHMVAYSQDHGMLGYWPAGADTSGYYAGVVPGAKANTGKVNNYTNTPEETRENLGIDFGKSVTDNIDFYGQVIYAHRHAEILEGYEYPDLDWPSGATTMYPNGVEPITQIDENDYSATLGLKGRHFLGFDWDLSTTWGADSDRISEKDSINLGMLASNCNAVDTTSSRYSQNGCGYSPTKFWDYTEKNAQWTNNLDFRRQFMIGHAFPIGLSFGAEQRMDEYQLVSGNPDSYQTGGAEGHAGIPPQSAGKWSRDVWAGYVDVNLHPIKHLQIDLAGRYEYYTDTQDTETGKISARYDFSRRIAVRGTISNGFRAPTLQEEHFSRMNVYTDSVRGLLPVSSEAAKILGASPLKPERSTNASGGVVLEPVNGFHVEADVYQINLRDRIVQGGTVSGEEALEAINNFGFAIPAAATKVSDFNAYYLSNGASTRTQGLDIKADYTFRFRPDYGTLNLGMALNLNRTRLHHNGTSLLGKPLLNAQTIGYLTTAYPRSKIILSALWKVGNWDINVRQTRYGETTEMLEYQDWTPASATCPSGGALRYSSSCFSQFKNTPRWLTDLQIGYRINKNLHVAVGANNIFNVRPREVSQQLKVAEGSQYDQDSVQVPINGGYYFGRIDANF